MKCYNCGNEIENDTTYCPYCNAKINNVPKGKVCSNCGYLNVNSAKFCKSCGTPLTQNVNMHQSSEKLTSKNSQTSKIIISALGVIIVLLCIILIKGKTPDPDPDPSINDNNNQTSENDPYYENKYPIDEHPSNIQVSVDGYSFSSGKYKLLYSIKVRKGPGVEYDRLTKSDLPSEYYNYSNDNGGLNPDTIIEVSEVRASNNRVWGKISCGWVCLYDEDILVTRL